LQETPEIHLTGPILDGIPNINEIINKRRFNPKNYPDTTFEEMMEANLRKQQT